jgi:drug/metabolite transporter superfamily protein YnfA
MSPLSHLISLNAAFCNVWSRLRSVRRVLPALQYCNILHRYGGFFIVLSYAWGWVVDHEAPDKMDCIGSAIALTGVLLAYFWPR